MRREYFAQIRISKKEHDLIKKFGAKKSDIWRIGFSQWIKNVPEKNQELADFHYKMYLQCIDNVNTSNDIIYKNINKLDQIIDDYLKSGRPRDPRKCDMSWIEARCEKYNLDPNDVLVKLLEVSK